MSETLAKVSRLKYAPYMRERAATAGVKTGGGGEGVTQSNPSGDNRYTLRLAAVTEGSTSII